jgi:hypothetical protein
MDASVVADGRLALVQVRGSSSNSSSVSFVIGSVGSSGGWYATTGSNPHMIRPDLR